MFTSLSHPFTVRTAQSLILGSCFSLNAMAETVTPEVDPPQTPKFEVGVQNVDSDTQGVIGFTMESDNTAIRLVGDYSRRSQHILLGGGLQLGKRHHLVGGLSVGREPIPNHTANMTGKSGLLRLSGAQPFEGIRQWFIDGLYQQTSSRLLSVNASPFDELKTQQSGVMQHTTFTQGMLQTREYFHGGRRIELAATVQANAGSRGVTSVQWLYGRTRLLDTTEKYDSWQIGYQHFLPAHQANWSISANTDRRFHIGTEMRLERIGATALVQAFKHTRDDRSHGVYLGLRFDLGQNSSKPGMRPEANVALLRETVHAMYAPRNYFGKILYSQERVISDSSTESVQGTTSAVDSTSDPAPTQIQLQQSSVLTLTNGADPMKFNLTLASPVTAGRLQCSDIALAPRTANTCTFTGGNALISVASDGTVTFGPGVYGVGSFVIQVTATDQAGNTYSTSLTLRHEVRAD